MRASTRTKDRHVYVRRGAALAAAASGLLTLAVAAGEGTGSGRLAEPMTALAGAFRDLEASLDGDPEAVAAAGAELRASARTLESFPLAEADPRLATALAPAAERIAALADEVARLSSAGRREGARQAFEAMRGACVSCHARFRVHEEDVSLYPAVEGTVAGSVRLVDVDGRPVDDLSRVLVFLESEEPASWVWRRDPPQIGQRGRRFDPGLLPVVQGTTVRFPNDDSLFHNVFSLSKTRPFDLGIYKQGESREVRFDRTGLVKVYCNIHPEMAASVVVLPNPWFALCAEDGTFVLPGVPAGSYRLRAWTEMGGDATADVEVVEGKVARVSLGLRETQAPSPHRNKFGREYPAKY